MESQLSSGPQPFPHDKSEEAIKHNGVAQHQGSQVAGDPDAMPNQAIRPGFKLPGTFCSIVDSPVLLPMLPVSFCTATPLLTLHPLGMAAVIASSSSTSCSPPAGRGAVALDQSSGPAALSAEPASPATCAEGQGRR